jgi:hypothetical protein
LRSSKGSHERTIAEHFAATFQDGDNKDSGGTRRNGEVEQHGISQRGNVMQALRDTLEQAQEHRVAIGHINVADLVLLKAVLGAAHELRVLVIIPAR